MNRMLNAMKFIVERSENLLKLNANICDAVQEVNGCDGLLGCRSCPFGHISNIKEMVEIYKELG